MRFLKRDIAALKKLVLEAKDAYYLKGSFLRIKLSAYSPEIATALKLGKLGRSASVILPEEASVSRGMLELDDARYDFLEKLIMSLDPSWKPISGAKPVVGKVKTKLPVPLSSLGKAYPDDGKVDSFSNKFPGPWVISDKLDGNALEVQYVKGIQAKAYTKTSPTVGQDVSFLVPHMDIPQKLNEDLVVRFETILPKGVFEKKHSRTSDVEGKKYKNARNMVAGIFNTKGVHKALTDIHVVAHEILNSTLSPSAQLRKLDKLGFTVVEHKLVSRISDSVLLTMLKKRRAASHYMIDGLVVTQDKPHKLSPTGDDPKYAIAFKMSDEEQFAKVRVIGIEWEVSKHGLLKPVVVVEGI